MRIWRALLMRLLRVGRTRSEWDAELQSHVQMHTDDGVRAGLSEIEARRHALIALGGVDQTRQVVRERDTLPWLESVAQDLRYALRGMRRNPMFAVTAIVTLALGIGATTAVFSVVDRILFRSLPYAQDDRLVSLGLVQSLEKQEFMLGGFFYEWQANQKPFEQITFERGTGECDVTEARPVRVQCAGVAQNFLPTLGVRPIVGRNFLPEEDLPHGPKVALISDGLWQSRFNRDPRVIDAKDSKIDLDGEPTRIIGVLPKDFAMPRLQPVDILVPARMDVAAQHTVNSGIGSPMWAFARLKPGISVARAKAEMEPLFLHTQQWIPAQFRGDFHLQVRSIRDRQMQEAYAVAWVLLGAVLAVLLIACANVASLFSARGAARQRELAVRAALGASRGRLIRQTLTEALLLAIMGAAAGVALAEALLRVFVAIAPTGVPFLTHARLDGRILGFTALVALGCALACAILPACEEPRPAALTSRASQSRRHARTRRLLVTTQIAISVALLSSASLLVKSFFKLQGQNLGMQTRNVLAVRVPLAWQKYPTPQAYMDFYLRLETALKRLPGVTAVGVSDSLPPDASSWHDGVRYPDIVVAGKPRTPAGVGGTVVTRKVTPGYFQALRIPVVEGRGFSDGDRTATAAEMVLSRKLAAQLFPQAGALGQHVQIATYMPYYALAGPVYTVVGVAADVKNGGLAGEDEPEYYTLRRDRPDDWSSHDVVILATTLPLAVTAQWVRSQVAQLDATAPVDVEPLTETVSKLADRPRFESALLGFFAACGLVMAVIGLYGVIAFVAAQRTQEIGVRMALGARRVDVLRLIMGEGVRLIAAGGLLGLAAAAGAGHLLRGLLFHVGPYDAATLASVAAVLTVVALAATLIPARAAMNTDPMTALRTE